MILVLVLMTGCTDAGVFELADVMEKRPASDGLVFDYVGLFQDMENATNSHLENIRNRYQIEVLIVALPGLSGKYTVNQAAVEIFNHWKIGKDFQGRGILLLLVDDIKEVKLEVGYELEDVFTDLFTGRVEDMQLRPHYGAGNLEIGLVAVIEELEARSEIKFKGDYSLDDIAGLDAQFLSQGAGARHVLEEHPQTATFSGTANLEYPAGKTPEEAWQTMIQRWRDKERDPHLQVFTPITRLAYRDFTQMPDARFEKEYGTYARKPYQILEDGDYAVVYFGRKTGWENAPFLFCRTPEGWQFDLVHQRRFIRMGAAPKWGVEFSEHPYMGLLMDSFQFRGQDIPLEGEDLYTVDHDTAWAEEIVAYEAAHLDNPQEFSTALALGRLYTLASMSRKGIGVLKKAGKLNPDDPRPYKYLAIGHVNAHYQYEMALKALEKYIQRNPQDHFGYNFAGYIHYRQKAYAKAADAFEKALELSPDNCYAHFYLAYTYAWLNEKALKVDPRRKFFKERLRHHAEQTRRHRDTHPIRVKQLNKWLEK